MFLGMGCVRTFGFWESNLGLGFSKESNISGSTRDICVGVRVLWCSMTIEGTWYFQVNHICYV